MARGAPISEVTARLERQLEAAQRITQTGSWEWDIATGVVTWSDELYRIYGLEPRSRPIDFEFFLGRIHPDDRERVQGDIMGALERGGRFAHAERIIWPDGSVHQLDSVGEVVHRPDGSPAGLIGTCRDVTEERRREEIARRATLMQAGERRALELLAHGAALGEVLTAIVRVIESLLPDSIASILLLDESGTKLRHGAAPGLPEAYNRAIDGASIGPAAGSCGTAAFRRAPVYVEDIETDPLWADYLELARAHGLRACWSAPIVANDGRVLGTFALYDRRPGKPSADARELIDRASHVAAIAIERRWLDDRMRALSGRIEAIREDERTSIAREIHDELGQALTALKMDLAWLARRIPGERPLTEKLGEMSRATDEIIGVVRRIAAELRPGILDDLGLLAATEWQAEEFEQRTGIRCRVTSNVGDLQLERNLATAVFRVLQEALTNVARHASATLVVVTLRLERGHLHLDVADDGVGIPETRGRASLGLIGMRERALRLGGECSIGGGPTGGTVVSLRVPLRFPSGD